MIFVPPGTTQLRVVVGLFDSSGAALTGKNATTFQLPVLSLIAGSQPGTLTLSNLANATASFSAGGVYELGAGRYRLDFTLSGAAQVITICAEGTLGSLLSETVVVTDSASDYFGTNILAVNGSAAAAAVLSLVTNDTNSLLKVSAQLNGYNLARTESRNTTVIAWNATSTIDANVTEINGDTSAAANLATIARLIPGQVSIQSPVISASLLRIVPGDDYLSADSRSLDFTFSNIPSLTGGTVTLRAPNFVLNGSITSASTVTFQANSTQTALLPVTVLPFTVLAVLSDSSNITLCAGNIDTRL